MGGLVLDAAQQELRKGAERVRLQPKVAQLFLHLIENRDRPVSTEELLQALWPDVHVTPASVKRAIYGARIALGDDGEAQTSIRTCEAGSAP